MHVAIAQVRRWCQPRCGEEPGSCVQCPETVVTDDRGELSHGAAGSGGRGVGQRRLLGCVQGRTKPLDDVVGFSMSCPVLYILSRISTQYAVETTPGHVISHLRPSSTADPLSARGGYPLQLFKRTGDCSPHCLCLASPQRSPFLSTCTCPVSLPEYPCLRAYYRPITPHIARCPITPIPHCSSGLLPPQHNNETTRIAIASGHASLTILTIDADDNE